MNPVSAAWDAFAGLCKAANAILSIIPPLVWAVALVLALAHGWFVGVERDHAVSAKNAAVGMYEALTAKVVRQKLEAQKLLAELTTRAQQAESALLEFRRNQQKVDDANKAIIADQARRLRDAAAAHGGQLRDPNAGRGCGGPGPEGQGAAGAASGAGDAAQGGGLLSAQLSGLLIRLTGESDTINRAYASCRADTLNLRDQLEKAGVIEVLPPAD
jgi:hypothetical protein